MCSISSRINNYLEYCKKQKKLSLNTIRAYQIDMNQFLIFLENNDLCEIDERDITKEMLRSYINQLLGSYAARTSKRKIACLKAFFNYLEYEDYIVVNPFRKIKIKIQEKQLLPRVIKQSDISEQLRYVYSLVDKTKSVYQKFVTLRMIACYELLIGTGIRIGELCNLRSEFIDLENRRIRIMGKGNRERMVYLVSNDLLQALRNYNYLREKLMPHSEFFFIGWQHNRMSEECARNMIRKIANKTAKKKITPHMFRHTFATVLLERGMDIRYIQELLGHSSIRTTQIYIHIANTTVRDAFERANLRALYG